MCRVSVSAPTDDGPRTTEATWLPPTTPWFINRNFVLLWSGQGISLVGDLVFDTTLVLWVATSIARGESWAPLAVSGVLMAALVPSMIVGPFAGVLVDRWDKRWAMLTMDAIRAVLIVLLVIAVRAVSLPFLPGGQPPRIWTLAIIYTVVVAATVCSAFANPASFALLGTVVDSSQRTAAATRLELENSMAIVIGPPLAALLFGLGVQWALLLNALSFAVSFLAALWMRVASTASEGADASPTGFMHEMAEGIRFFIRSPVLVTISASIMVAIMGGGALSTLNVFFVSQNLHAPARLYGVLTASLGAGSVIGALLATVIVGRMGGIRTFWMSLVATGGLLFIYSRLTSFSPAVVVFFIFGFPNSALNVALGPLLFQVVPPEMIGRVMSLFMPLLSAGRLVGAILAGVLVSSVLRGLHARMLGQTFGPVDTTFLAAGLLCLIAGVYTAWKLPSVPAPSPE
jgi:MFS family permease